MASWKQFASPLNSNETSFSRPKAYEGSDAPANLRDIHEHVAGIEAGLYEEIERRTASEERIKEQVEAKIKVAVGRLADVTETEMARMYRRIEADLADRLDAMSREIASMSGTLRKLTNQVELITVESRTNKAAIVQLEQRWVTSGSSETGFVATASSSAMSNNFIAESSKEQFEKLKELISNDLDNSKKLADIDTQINRKLYPRVETIEDWLKTNLTPEILRIKEKLQLETLNREQNDRDIMDLVSEYTSLIQRHFEIKKDVEPPRKLKSETVVLPSAFEVTADDSSASLPSLTYLPQQKRVAEKPVPDDSQISGRSALTRIFSSS